MYKEKTNKFFEFNKVLKTSKKWLGRALLFFALATLPSSPESATSSIKVANAEQPEVITGTVTVDHLQRSSVNSNSFPIDGLFYCVPQGGNLTNVIYAYPEGGNNEIQVKRKKIELALLIAQSDLQKNAKSAEE